MNVSVYKYVYTPHIVHWRRSSILATGHTFIHIPRLCKMYSDTLDCNFDSITSKIDVSTLFAHLLEFSVQSTTSVYAVDDDTTTKKSVTVAKEEEV